MWSMGNEAFFVADYIDVATATDDVHFIEHLLAFLKRFFLKKTLIDTIDDNYLMKETMQ